MISAALLALVFSEINCRCPEVLSLGFHTAPATIERVPFPKDVSISHVDSKANFVVEESDVVISGVEINAKYVRPKVDFVILEYHCLADTVSKPEHVSEFARRVPNTNRAANLAGTGPPVILHSDGYVQRRVANGTSLGGSREIAVNPYMGKFEKGTRLLSGIRPFLISDRQRAASCSRSLTRPPSGEASSKQGSYADYQANETHSRHFVSGISTRLGGVRSTRLLDEIVALQAMLFGCLSASVSFARSSRPGEPGKSRWVAFGAAGAVVSIGGLAALVSGQIWLPWL